MRIGCLSDIHGNALALEAVLEAAARIARRNGLDDWARWLATGRAGEARR